MKLLATLALIAAPLCAAPALAQQQAQDSRAYFTARLTQRATPQQ